MVARLNIYSELRQEICLPNDRKMLEEKVQMCPTEKGQWGMYAEKKDMEQEVKQRIGRLTYI